MTISLRLDNDESILIKKYAELKQITVSELIRQTVMERIEDEIDMEYYNRAMAEYKNNPVTYTLDEVEKELGL
jgi:uncharacterized protein (DUF1778 family)